MKFKPKMWMLSALIIPIGIGLSIRDVLLGDSIPLGGDCSDSDHCKAPADTCLQTPAGDVCTMTCATCPDGFECTTINVTLKNSAGFHDLGGQNYCFPTAMAEQLSR
jgi:hypothetical protein